MARFEELNNGEYQKRNETNELFIPPGPRLGDKVIEVQNLTKTYGDRTLIDNLSFSIPKGAIVGIIGPNGAGKSTLFRMLSGQEQPDSGTITLGETVVLASVNQFRDAMDDKKPCGKKSLTDKIFYVLVILKFQAVLMWDALTLKVSINKNVWANCLGWTRSFTPC